MHALTATMCLLCSSPGSLSREVPGSDFATRYYYEGSSVIEERDGAEVRPRYHVNGAQYIDERVTTLDDATGEFSYYILKDLFTVSGVGDADGERRRASRPGRA